MLDQVLAPFQIKPNYDLDIMRENQSLFDITMRVLAGLKPVLEENKPDLALIQGDTTTAFAASLAAFYLKIPIGHVEAGLRTGNKYNPFPEEMNRVLVDDLSDFCFAPTVNAKRNLLGEGIPPDRILVTGNTIVDALLWVSDRQAAPIQRGFLTRSFEKIAGIPLRPRRIILVTGHRRESFGKGIESICRGLKAIAERNREIQIIYLVHLNPNVREPVYHILEGVENIHLTEPLSYPLFVFLMSRAYLILTDSGGIQEEAPSLGKPVLVMRETTERSEALETGGARLVGTDSERIFAETQKLLDDEAGYERMATAPNPFGDGKAAKRIVDFLVKQQ
jgi:UDP-N-acetylglucosamine 2-epimerase (non-hydrolysing)